MALTVECIHWNAPAEQITCKHCGELAITREEITAAKEKALDYIARMAKNPNSCSLFQQAIADERMLFAIDWRGTGALLLALNQIHQKHDAPSLHGHDDLFSSPA